MNRFYIRFAGDNDFITTVLEFAKLIAHFVLDGQLTKKQVVDIFNEHVFTIYMFYQNQWQYESSHVKDYLQITEDEVMFDDEIEQSNHFKTKNFNHDGCLVTRCNNDDITVSII